MNLTQLRFKATIGYQNITLNQTYLTTIILANKFQPQTTPVLSNRSRNELT